MTLQLSNLPQDYVWPDDDLSVIPDWVYTDQAIYEQFLREHNVIFKAYRDPGTDDNHRSPLAQNYGTSMYPETYIIDRKGVILRKIIGPQDWNSPEMLAYFDAILGKS